MAGEEEEAVQRKLNKTVNLLDRTKVSYFSSSFSFFLQTEQKHLYKITEDAGTEEAEADAEFDNALKEAIRGVQDAVTWKMFCSS